MYPFALPFAEMGSPVARNIPEALKLTVTKALKSFPFVGRVTELTNRVPSVNSTSDEIGPSFAKPSSKNICVLIPT
jgi:hypothetical protein